MPKNNIPTTIGNYIPMILVLDTESGPSNRVLARNWTEKKRPYNKSSNFALKVGDIINVAQVEVGLNTSCFRVGKYKVTKVFSRLCGERRKYVVVEN